MFAGLAALTHEHGALLAVDNTFLTPLLQDCLKLGADISMLSTTKYIDGHNATIGGSLATHDMEQLERLRLVRKTMGTIATPFDAWLTLQGLKTLPARMEMHCRNAAEIAAWLEGHTRVSGVNYPGLDSFVQKALAGRSSRVGLAACCRLSLRLTRRDVEVYRLAEAVTGAESLGSVETLITNPATASHCDLTVEERAHLGVTDGLVRLSVGLESPKDLIADFEQAFTAVFG